MKSRILNLIWASVGLIVWALMYTSQSEAKIDPETAVGVWLFDEGSGNIARDSSGKGNDGKIENGPKWVDGKFGKALEFDGKDDYVYVSDPGKSSLDLTKSLTIAAWVKPVQHAQGNVIVNKRANVAPCNYTLRLADGTDAEFDFWYNSGSWQGYTTNTGGIVKDKTWYHVASTYASGKGDDVKLYVNGKTVEGKWTAGDGKGKLVANDEDFNIGGRDYQGTRWFEGLIDEVAIFEVVLTKADIMDIMKDGLFQAALAVSPTGKLATSWGGLKAQY